MADYTRALGIGAQQPDPLQLALGGINQGMAQGAEMALAQSKMAAQQRQEQAALAQQKAAAQQQAQYQADVKALNSGEMETKAFITRNPAVGAKLGPMLQEMDEKEREPLIQTAFTVSNALSNGDDHVAISALAQEAKRKQLAGDDAGAKVALQQVDMILDGNGDQVREQATTFAAFGLGPEKFDKGREASRASRFAKDDRARDLKDRDIATRKAGADATSAEVDAKYAEDLKKGELAKQRAERSKFLAAASGLRKQDKVNVQSVITRYKDGTAVVQMRDGTNRVTTPGVEGFVPVSEQKAVIENALGSGVSYEKDITTAREGAKVSQNLGKDAFKMLGPLRKQVTLIGQQLTALDKPGANVGPIYDKLPTLTSASKELEALTQQGALDTLSLVSMGALSDNEMKVLMDVNVPRGMTKPELKAYLKRKQNAFKKAIPALKRQATFYSNGGTIAEWIAKHDPERARRLQGSGSSRPASRSGGVSRFKNYGRR